LQVRAGDEIPFPVDYRSWAVAKTALVGPQSPAFATEAGIHHIYANAKGLEGYETGKFPDGSILVYELLETKEASGVTTEGAVKRLDVMVKDSQRFKEGNGWDFASFRDGSRTGGTVPPERKAGCVRCHGQKKDHDSVFSDFRK
jgi:hypothetical protein